MLAGGFTSSRGRPARSAAVVAGVLGLLLTLWASGALAERPASVSDTVITISGSTVLLGYLIVPFLSGQEDLLDPRRFAVVSGEPRKFVGAAMLAALVSVPTVAVALFSAVAASVRIDHGTHPVVAIAAALLGTVTCVAAARVALLAASVVRRPGRGALVPVSVAILTVGASVLTWLALRGVRGATRAADVLRSTPLGAAWTLGEGGVGQAVVAILTAAVLLAAWAVGFVRSGERTDAPRAQRTSQGWFVAVPRFAWSVIAARSFVYWLRDPRYLANLIGVPIGITIAVSPLLLVGVPVGTVALLPPALLALFLGWLVHNDLAHDSTAVWLHVAGGARGFSDRVGRVVPPLVLGGVIVAASVTIAMLLSERTDLLPALIGACAALFLGGLGWSSLASALAPYPAAAPGASPFEQPQRTSGFLTQLVVLLLTLAVGAPSLWWGWQAWEGEVRATASTAWIGVGIGAGVLLAGTALGSWAFEHRRTRLLDDVEAA